jgi:hypothetical protein
VRSRVSFALALIPVVLSSWLIGAHFLRFFAVELVALFLLLPLILLVRRSWAVRVMQVALLLGTFIWIRTAWNIAERRMAAGEPWGRMALILGAVGAVALLSALLLETSPFKRRYQLRTQELMNAAPSRPGAVAAGGSAAEPAAPTADDAGEERLSAAAGRASGGEEDRP